LIPCSGEETTDLARDIHRILRRDYGLEDQVDILFSRKRASIDPGVLKDHRHPQVSDFFPDIEAEVDIGRNPLKDVVRGKHVVLVEHLLTPNRKVYGKESSDPQKVSVNDHIMVVKGFLDVINKVETLQATLVAPYLSYLRSHSVKQYEARGFFQFDSLSKTLKDYRDDGLNALLTIDPHSPKAVQVAEELGMDFHGINPFQSGRSINPYKLGLSGEKAKEIIKRLRPFHERFAELKKEYGEHLYIVSVDNGTERRVENFADRAFAELPPEDVYARVIYFYKGRPSYLISSMGIKNFSQINEKNIDKEGLYIIIDDMYASGSSANKVAHFLKEKGAKRVEVWVSHAVTMPIQQEKANNRDYIDKVVCLDTVPQHPDLDVEYIKASADLLAAELYKTHQKLVASR